MSRHIQIDFAKPTWYQSSAWSILAIGFFCLSIFICIVAHRFLQEQQKQLAIMQQTKTNEKLQHLNSKRVAVQTPLLNQDQITALSDMVVQLKVSWNPLFNALEEMQNSDVVLIRILPNFDRQQLELIGEARNLTSIFTYIESLESLPMLEHVTLQKHQVVESHPHQPVEFSIQAGWKS